MQNTKLAPIKWAQRKDKIFMTVDTRDIKNEKIDLKEESFEISFTSDGTNYHASLNFFAAINVSESKWASYGLNFKFDLVKKEADSAYWKRLTKETTKF